MRWEWVAASRIDLPYLNSSPAAAETQQQLKLDPSEPEELSPLILLAEDNEANINTIAVYLEAKGYRMLLAKDGQEAINLAQLEHPDLILMDIQMPVIDGLEAIEKIRCDPSLVDVPIIALTALAMTGDRERCLAVGANAYLSKPVKLKQLTAMIQQFLQPHPPSNGFS